MNVLWITTESKLSSDTSYISGLHGISIDVAVEVDDALASLRTKEFDAAVVNSPLAELPVEEILDDLHRVDCTLPVLIRDANPSLSHAVRLTKLGAFHFVSAEAPTAELRAFLFAAYEYGQARQPVLVMNSRERWRGPLVGRSRAFEDVVEIVRLVGPRKCTVLITGETGTGKELVARALHESSGRPGPLVAVNCHALPDNLLEAELFGHVRGAFTGALNHRVGRFEQASRGTIFLDEIADMPLDLQAKLLRVLQEREFQRVGSSETVRVDVRVVAACNVDLLERVRAGRFREDLYYRLNVVGLELPPLRERLEDVPLLAHHFVKKICEKEELPTKRLSQETSERLMSFGWPGNVRQLENAIEAAIVLSGERQTLFPSDFRLPVTNVRPMRVPVQAPVITIPDHGLDFERTVGQIERHILEQALQRTRGNKKQAAEMLRLKRTTLAAKLKSLEAIAG